MKRDPLVQKLCIEVTASSLEDQRSDSYRLFSKHIEQELNIPLSAYQKLSNLKREACYKITIVSDQTGILNLEPGDTSSVNLGIVLDLGTTIIHGYLIDLTNGQVLSQASRLNPQLLYGVDIISRITHIAQGNDSLMILQECIIQEVNLLIEVLTEDVGFSTEDIYAITVIGNTCMHHIFLGLNPTNIALYPHVPVTQEPIVVKAKALCLNINEFGKIYLLPTISGFIGSDTVSVIQHSGLDRSDQIKLLINIGANSEIILGNKEKIIACSIAFCSAIEGARNSCVKWPTKGAVNAIDFTDNIDYYVIGEGKPSGICSSGLIDAVAGLHELGLINNKGRILSPYEINSNRALPYIDNLIRCDINSNAFLIIDETKTDHLRPIIISQQDIRGLQLVKAAFSTGIYLLCCNYRISVKDISEVLMAGTDEYTFNSKSLCTIGMIPPELSYKVCHIGNAAGEGAIEVLLSRKEFDRAKHVSELVSYVELTSHPGFNKRYTQSLNFNNCQA